jgi:rhodanese-related sulfurtransferase
VRRFGRWTAAALAPLAGLALLTAPFPARAGHSGPIPPYVATLPAEYVKRLLDRQEPLLFVDMRKPGEFRAGHLPGAMSLPITEVDRRFGEIPRSGRVVFYCSCPLEEIATVYTFLRSQGYRNHAILEGGIEGWLRHGYPVAR